MALKIYDTLTRKKRNFTPTEGRIVTFYQCGPTVYWVQQIGNMRAMVLADLIRRSIEYIGYSVVFVRNYTDVGHLTGDNLGDADTGEDRMEKSAKTEGVSPDKIAEKYIGMFEADIKALNIQKPNHTPRATEYIEQIIRMVQTLIDKDFAYITPKAVYFDISKVKDYNKLNKQNLDENKEGAGSGDVSDTNKRNPQDFSLWFFKTGTHKNALQFWPSPFNSSEVNHGEGFPGWHIECSAMVKSLLGDTIDIHMGGVEHIPIHHTNEIAQSEAVNEKEFVRFWLHNEHLLVDGKKMGKSEGNAYTLKDCLNHGNSPLALRYFFLQAHYRSKQNFTWDGLDAAEIAFSRLKNSVVGLKIDKGNETQKTFKDNYKKYENDFRDSVGDDFNIPQALAVAHKVLKADLPDGTKYDLLAKFDKVLGLELFAENPIEIVPEQIHHLTIERERARKNKDFKKSDELREKIELLGYQVTDSEFGQEIKKKH